MELSALKLYKVQHKPFYRGSMHCAIADTVVSFVLYRKSIPILSSSKDMSADLLLLRKCEKYKYYALPFIVPKAYFICSGIFMFTILWEMWPWRRPIHAEAYFHTHH